MFREGQYLEVIKASDNCLATAVVTVQEKTIELKRKKISTNKWLNLEDWAALYEILERAILRNSRDEKRCPRKPERCQWRKSTRQLDVTYTIEPSECAKDLTSLLTIRVNVSPARKKKSMREDDSTDRKSNSAADHATKRAKILDATTNYEDSTKGIDANSRDEKPAENPNAMLEEYVPDAPQKTPCSDFKYVPSRKSALQKMQIPSNEYTPTQQSSKKEDDSSIVRYVPNSVQAFNVCETYEPHATTNVAFAEPLQEYVPTSKGAKANVEEYEPDFTSKAMKFDDSYVPSSLRTDDGTSKRSLQKLQKFKLRRLESHRTGSTIARKSTDLF